jgi:hypothetical protein
LIIQVSNSSSINMLVLPVCNLKLLCCWSLMLGILMVIVQHFLIPVPNGKGHVLVKLVQELCYKLEGCGFKSHLGLWIFSVYLICPAVLWPWSSLNL